MVNPPVLFSLENFRPNFPNRGAYTFCINVDGSFIGRCMAHKITRAEQQGFNKIGSKIIRDVLRDRMLSPYLFEEDSLLVTQCSLGRDGEWLSADRNHLDRLEAVKDRRELGKNIPSVEYNGHNIDTPAQAYALLSLLTTWAEYAQVLLPEQS